MTLQHGSPMLLGDFGLVPVEERLAWQNALALHVLERMELSTWKKQEQVQPLILTISRLVEQGLTDPRAIADRILHQATT